MCATGVMEAKPVASPLLIRLGKKEKETVRILDISTIFASRKNIREKTIIMKSEHSESFFPNRQVIGNPSGQAELVASGGTADCYKVLRHGKWFLQKRLKKELQGNVLYQQAFQKELEIGIQLEHPNIARYVYGEETAEGSSILMEYIDGERLDHFLKKHPAYFKERKHRKQFVEELLSALSYLHGHEILHLDLKPQNILLTRIGNHVKLIDLGFAYKDCYWQPTGGGTRRYAAPEQWDKQTACTPATDIYALGHILEETGIGHPAIRKRCLAEKAAARYQSVGELGQALARSFFPWRKMAIAMGLLLVAIGMSWQIGHRLPPRTVKEPAIQEQEIPAGQTDIPQATRRAPSVKAALSTVETWRKEYEQTLRGKEQEQARAYWGRMDSINQAYEAGLAECRRRFFSFANTRLQSLDSLLATFTTVVSYQMCDTYDSLYHKAYGDVRDAYRNMDSDYKGKRIFSNYIDSVYQRYSAIKDKVYQAERDQTYYYDTKQTDTELDTDTLRPAD